MNLFHSSISSLDPSSSSSSSTVASDSHACHRPSVATLPAFPRAFNHRPSTTPTNATTPTTDNSTSRVLSAFNPTKTYHIPMHGGLIRSQPLHIYDLTPLLKNRVPAADSYTDRKQFKREVQAILKAKRGRDKEFQEHPLVLDTAAVMTKGKGGGMVVEDQETGGIARWSVPWPLWKEIVVGAQYPGRNEWAVGVWTHDFDPRSQIFESRGASYRWKFVSSRELVLEKSAVGMGRYIVAVFYLTVSSTFFPGDMRMWVEGVVKRGACTTEGTLLFDERGVDRLLVVATLLIALKRERQRWGVLGGTV